MTYGRLYMADATQQWRELPEIHFQTHGDGLIAHVGSNTNRADAELLRNLQLASAREDLPTAAPDEYYWVDLIGLDVSNDAGVVLGSVSDVVDNGSSAVIEVVGRECKYLIPMVKPILQSVDLDVGVLVAWDEDWTA